MISRVLASLACALCLAPSPSFAQERAGLPVALDFTPLGASVASTTGKGAAPADTNFGVYPLSVMGIENAIRRADGNVSAYARGELRVDDGPIAYSVVAIRDWERRYPSDPWIAKDLLALARFYAHVGTSETRTDAERAAAWVEHDYPQTAYAEAAERVVASRSETHGESHAETRAAAPVEARAPAPAPAAPAPANGALPSYARPIDANDPWSRFPPYAAPDGSGH